MFSEFSIKVSFAMLAKAFWGLLELDIPLYVFRNKILFKEIFLSPVFDGPMYFTTSRPR